MFHGWNNGNVKVMYPRSHYHTSSYDRTRNTVRKSPTIQIAAPANITDNSNAKETLRNSSFVDEYKLQSHQAKIRFQVAPIVAMQTSPAQVFRLNIGFLFITCITNWADVFLTLFLANQANPTIAVSIALPPVWQLPGWTHPEVFLGRLNVL